MDVSRNNYSFEKELYGLRIGVGKKDRLNFAFNILKVKDLYNLKLASLMWYFDHNQLPKRFKSFFSYANEKHKCETSFAMSNKLYQGKKFNTNSYGTKSFANQEPKIMNILKSLPLYIESKSKNHFIRN